jgi:transposase-like protein
MKPRWIKPQVACPECGHTLNASNFHEAIPEAPDGEQAFDCPKCKAHFTEEEFWQEQNFKWG